jgi:hypothetical protein
MICPSGGQLPTGLLAARRLATLKAYLVFFLNMVCLTVALTCSRLAAEGQSKFARGCNQEMRLFCKQPSATVRQTLLINSN